MNVDIYFDKVLNKMIELPKNSLGYPYVYSLDDAYKAIKPLLDDYLNSVFQVS